MSPMFMFVLLSFVDDFEHISIRIQYKLSILFYFSHNIGFHAYIFLPHISHTDASIIVDFKHKGGSLFPNLLTPGAIRIFLIGWGLKKFCVYFTYILLVLVVTILCTHYGNYRYSINKYPTSIK